MADKEKKRERYANDTQFREHLKDYERQRYREQHAVNVRDCSTSLQNLTTFGQKRTVIHGDNRRSILTFSTKEVAEAIKYHPTRVRQWQGAGKFPKPKLQVEGSKLFVYTLKQAKMIVATIARHQEVNQYLRDDHTETITLLHRAMSL